MKFGVIHPRHGAVQVTVRADFVSFGRDLSRPVRMALHVQADEEKGGVHPGFTKGLEHFRGVDRIRAVIERQGHQIVSVRGQVVPRRIRHGAAGWRYGLN